MSDLRLATSTYDNYCEMWRVVGALADLDSAFHVEQRPEMLFIRSRFTQRVPHMALDPRVRDADAPDWVRKLVQLVAGEPASLLLGVRPGSENGALVRALLHEGFSRGSRPALAMAREADPLVISEPDLDIHRASSSEELDEARALLSRIFGLPGTIFAFYTPAPQVHTYVLRQHGVPVAAACLCPFAGSAGIYSVGVLPSARGNGFAQRLVRHALADATAAGITRAVLSCDRSLAPLYRRLGFIPCWELATYWLESWWC